MKKSINLLLSFFIVFSMFVTVNAENELASAKNYVLGDSKSDSVLEGDESDIYKFNLDNAGIINIRLSAEMKRINIKLYDKDGNELWKDTPYWNDTTELISYQKKLHLCEGLYYISFSCYHAGYDEYYGDYNIEITHTAVYESFKEIQNGNNNSIKTANQIECGSKYIGYITLNDDTDIYKFNLPQSGKIDINFVANAKRMNIKLYDENAKEIWKDTPYWNDTTEQISFSKETKLSAGTYYISISNYYNGYDEYYGNFSFYLTDGGYVQEVPLVNSTINVKINGTDVQFDQHPILENGRTLVPLRAIFEALGANVQWDGNTQTVTATKDGTQISLQIGSTQMYVNGGVKTLDVPAKLISSRTLVPVRAISEAFGCKVDWVQETQTVVITQ